MALLLILFEGGAWDGRTSKIDASGSGRAERWAKDEGEIHVYQRTRRQADVTVEHDTRSGKKLTTESATVYELVERKPSPALRNRDEATRLVVDLA